MLIHIFWVEYESINFFTPPYSLNLSMFCSLDDAFKKKTCTEKMHTSFHPRQFRYDLALGTPHRKHIRNIGENKAQGV